VNEQDLIAIKQADWFALEAQRQRLDAAIGNLRVLSEMHFDSLDKTAFLDKIADCESRLEEIDYAMFDLENWLIDHNAPGWVAT